MPSFDKIAPFLTNPLVVVGLVIFSFYGLLRIVLKAAIIPQLSQSTGGQVIKSFLRYSFIIGIVTIILGFAVEALHTFITAVNQGRLNDNRSISDQLNLVFLQQHALYFEHISVNPGSIAFGLKDADKGFVWKYQYLSAKLLITEARVLSEVAQLRGPVARSYTQHEDLGKLYDKLRIDSALHGQLDEQVSQKLSQIVHSAQLAYDYSELAEFVVQHHEFYTAAANLMANGNVTAATEKLRAISADLMNKNLIQSGGYYSHLGTLALAYSNKEEALSLYYKGITVDQRHIPLYEGLGLSLWALNHDPTSALDYVAKGLELIQQLKPEVTSGCLLGYDEINGLLSDDGEHVALYEARLSRLKSLCASLENTTDRYVEYFMESFKNLYAYFSTIMLKNEDEARRYANELHDKHPEDLDYAETAAFVAWRFARTRDELIGAAQCLQIISRLATDPFTVKIASLHYERVLQKIRDLDLSDNIIPKTEENTLNRCRAG